MTGPDGREAWVQIVRHVLNNDFGIVVARTLRLGAVTAAALDAFDADPSEEAFAKARSLFDAEKESAHRSAEPDIAAWRADIEARGLPSEDLAALAAILRARLNKASLDELAGPCPQLRDVVRQATGAALDQLRRDKTRDRIRAVVGYADHVERLRASRPPRRVVFHVGPTNSGKTHDAMAELTGAATGVYLAPLRLLALEGYERLRENGVAAGMVTGEESAGLEDATHISMTIEMANLGREVEVAVIDEVQMLLDPNRGWAWTRALFGLRCQVLHLCGSEDAFDLVMKAARILGEEVEVVRHRRMAPLRFVPGKVAFGDVEAGDAVVAFTRKDVLTIRETLIGRGYRVSCVYGALSPDVRRSEAHRFRSGQADVLVATDAIGMGLNLGPLRRVVLTTTRKFDGKTMRTLRPSEIRQIAGRAGRFGHQAEGLVAVMDDSAYRVQRALAGQPDPVKPDGLFFVRPEIATLDEAARETGAKDLLEVLRVFTERTVYEGSPYKPGAFEETLRIATAIKDSPLPASVAFTFTNCPIDRRHPPALAWLVRQAAARSAGESATLPPAGSPAIVGASEGLAAHEAEAGLMTAYLWLSKRFPDTFPDTDEAASRLREADARIEAELSKQAFERANRAPKGRTRASRLAAWFPQQAQQVPESPSVEESGAGEGTVPDGIPGVRQVSGQLADSGRPGS